MNYLHVSLEFLESFATNVADLRIVNTFIVTPFSLRCTEYFVTGNTREFCASLFWRFGNTWDVFPHHVFLQFVSRVSDVITDTAGQRLTMYRVKVVPERLVRLADEFTLVTEHMTPVGRTSPHSTCILLLRSLVWASSQSLKTSPSVSTGEFGSLCYQIFILRCPLKRKA